MPATNEISFFEHKCELISEELERIFKEFNQQVASGTEVNRLLKKVFNRSKEYKNGSFIVLVVGPVKSGKSTLVNLISDAYVSPTHFLECTVRPSIISQQKEGEKSAITVYTSLDLDDKVEQIDSIIDCIRGMDEESSLKNISIGKFDLTRENIKDKVELGLQESLEAETLVTSITTPGGQLLRENVFLVDMPGFDGSFANMDNPIYDTIAQRADLIVFVQSSNSAITKISAQFLEVLKKNNQQVPVCLIHNVFDSAIWRDVEERTADAEEQKKFAVEMIRNAGFSISNEEPYAFNINLGKVTDSRIKKYEHNQDLQEEARRFSKIESVLYDRVINNRDIMRLQNCLSRTTQQNNYLTNAIQQEIESRKELLSKYERLVLRFEDLNKQIATVYNGSSIKDEFTSIDLKAIITEEYTNMRDQIAPQIHLSDSEAKSFVEEYITSCEKSIALSFQTPELFSSTEETLFLKYKNFISDITNLATEFNIKTEKTLLLDKKIKVGINPKVELSNCINYSTLIPHIPYFPILGRGGHTAAHLVNYIEKVKNRFIGGKNDNNGYLDSSVIKMITNELNNQIKLVIKGYTDNLRSMLQITKSSCLKSIIPSIDSFKQESKTLDYLYSRINNLL